MILFHAPGASSQAPHILLREAGLPFALERVDLPEEVQENVLSDFLRIGLVAGDAVRQTMNPGGELVHELLKGQPVTAAEPVDHVCLGVGLHGRPQFRRVAGVR